MTLTQTEFLIVCLILSIVAHAISVLMKSPKEAIKELTVALSDLREDHNELAKRFERHDVINAGLTNALDRLTQRIDKLEPVIHRATKIRGA